MTVFSKFTFLLFSWTTFHVSASVRSYIPCNLFKKGKFIVHERNVKAHSMPYDVFIERNDTMELHTSNITADTVFYSVQWLSDCAYTRTLIRTKWAILNGKTGMNKLPATDTITISEGAGKYYLQQLRNKTDTVWIKELWITLEDE